MESNKIIIAILVFYSIFGFLATGYINSLNEGVFGVDYTDIPANTSIDYNQSYTISESENTNAYSTIGVIFRMLTFSIGTIPGLPDVALFFILLLNTITWVLIGLIIYDKIRGIS